MNFLDTDFSFNLPDLTPASAIPRPWEPKRALFVPARGTETIVYEGDVPLLDQDDYVLYIDNSTLELATTCNRKMEYYTVHRREAVSESAATNFGSAIHSGIEAFVRSNLTSVPASAALASAVAAIQKHFAAHPVHFDWRTEERAVSVMTSYAKRYGNRELFTYPFDTAGKPIIERPFSVELCVLDINSQIRYEGEDVPRYIRRLYVVWTGRLDAFIRWEDRFRIKDIKTSSLMGPTFWEDFQISSQMLGYMWAAKQIFPAFANEIVGLLLDVVYIRPPGKEEGRTEFHRQRYDYSDDQIAEWKRDTVSNIVAFVNNLVDGYFPKKPKWCHGKYGRCPYFDVCTSTPTGAMRNTMLESELFANVTWSPLNDRT